MQTKMYVGNLLYEVTDNELRTLFSQFGTVVSAEIVKFKKTKRSKGFGYVKMASHEEAQNAIASLNDQDFRGRKLFLQFARSEDPAPEVMQQLQQEVQQQEQTQPMTPVASPEPITQATQAVQAEEAYQGHQEQQQEQEQQEFQERQEAVNYTPSPAAQEHIARSGTIFSGSGNRDGRN